MIMYELRQSFKAQLHPILVRAGIGPLMENMILSAFDQAVEDEEKRSRTELARAGLITSGSRVELQPAA